MDTQKVRAIQRQIAKLTASLTQAADEGSVPTFEEVAKKHLAAKLSSPGLRPATKRSFEYNVRCHLLPAFGALPIDKLTGVNWNEWVAKVRSTPGSLTRFFNARKALTEILNAAKDEGVIERTPKLENPDEPKNVGRVLEESEILSIIRNTTYPLFKLFFYVLWKTGCRPREILKWEWSFIQWNEPGHSWIEIPARISKTVRARKIPLNPDVSKALKRIFDKGPSSPFVFPNRKHEGQPQLSYHGAWRTACTRAGISAVPYDLRRTFITRAAAAGAPLLYVAKLLDTSVKMIEAFYAKSQKEVMEGIVA